MASSDYYFTTDDGVKLHYEEAGGSGDYTKDRVLLLLPGWSQTSREFASQITELSSATRRVIALDPRGHGKSECPPLGTYKIDRYAQDVRNMLVHLKLPVGRLVDVVAHSASCCVMWRYVERYGGELLRSVVFVDQMILYAKDNLTDEEIRKYGASGTREEVQAFLDSLIGADAEATTREFTRSMFSDELSDEAFESILQNNLKFPRVAAAEFAGDVMAQDFRETLPKVTLPALCIGGSESHIPPDCIEHQASLIGPTATTNILPGTHFMFLEHAEQFNMAVLDFLNSQQERKAGAQ